MTHTDNIDLRSELGPDYLSMFHCCKQRTANGKGLKMTTAAFAYMLVIAVREETSTKLKIE